jgi:RNA polymerase sigma-70 factor (ECF subfamily)
MFMDADGRLVSVMSLDISGGTIVAIRNVLNPEKLDHLGRPLSDLALRRR